MPAPKSRIRTTTSIGMITINNVQSRGIPQLPVIKLTQCLFPGSYRKPPHFLISH